MTKRLFTLAMMFICAFGAWADETTIYERKTNDGSLSASTSATQVSANWSTNDIYNSEVSATTGGWTLEGTPSNVTATIDDGLKLQGNNGNSKSQAFTYSKAISVSSNTSILRLTADWDYSKNRAGNSDDVSYYSFLKIGDVEVRFTGKDYKMITVCNGETIQTEPIGYSYFADGSYANISVTINQSSKTVSYKINIYKSSTDESPLVKTNSTGTTGNGVTYNLSAGYSKAGGGSATTDIIKNIKVTEEAQDVTYYNYTVNYKLGDNVVKTVTNSLSEGATIPVLTALDGEGDYSGNHYLISDNETPSWTISTTVAENTHDVEVRAPYSTTLTVTRYFDGVAEATPYINGQALVETDDKVANWVYSFPYYVQKDEKWYKATLKDGKFGEEGTFTTDAINKTIEYTIDNTVINFWDYSHNNYVDNINYSGGSKNDYQQGQTIGSLDAGKYEVTVMQDNNYSAKLYKDYTDANNQGTELLEFNSSNRTRTLTLSENASGLQIASSGNSRYDYVLVRKLPTPAVEGLTAANLTYTGSAQNLVTKPNVTGGTIYYSTTSAADGFDTAIPTGINAGNYNVWYKVVGDETHNDIAATEVEGVKINKATYTVEGTATATAASGTLIKNITIEGLTVKNVSNETITGSWAFSAEETAELSADNTTAYTATFTPSTEDNNYEELTKQIIPTITSVSYTVEHYQQNIDDDEYTKVDGDTQTINTGNVGQQTAAEAKTYEGFTAQSFDQATIKADGSTVVKIYYTRNSYTITFDSDGGSDVAAISGKYGSAVTAPADPTKINCVFEGWYNGNNKYTFSTMPAENLELKAMWTDATPNNYTINSSVTSGSGSIKYVTKDANNKDITEDLEGVQFENNTVVKLVAIPETGYQLNSWKVDGVEKGGSLVLELSITANTTVTADFSSQPSTIPTITTERTWTFDNINAGTALSGQKVFEYDGLYIAGHNDEISNLAIVKASALNDVAFAGSTISVANRLELKSITSTAIRNITEVNNSHRDFAAFKAGAPGKLYILMACNSAKYCQIYTNKANSDSKPTMISTDGESTKGNGNTPVVVEQTVSEPADIYIGGSGDMNIYAIKFVPDSYTFKATAGENGSITVMKGEDNVTSAVAGESGATYPYGTTLVLTPTATNSDEYEFDKWTTDGTTELTASDDISINETTHVLTVNLKANLTVIATFKEKQKYTVTKEDNPSHCNYTVSPIGKVVVGQTITLTATPDDGYYISSIKYTYKDETEADKTITVKSYSDKQTTVVETFEMPAYDINMKVGTQKENLSLTAAQVEHGSISFKDKDGNAITTARIGDQVTVVSSPDENYTLSSLSAVDTKGNSVSIVDNKFTMPAYGVTVTATFVSTTHTHSFSCEVGTGDNFNVLTATCQTAGCDLTGSKTTLTLNANGGTYNGSPFAATTDLDAFNQTTGLNATCSINYSGDNDYSSSTAPTNVGNYTATATVTIGETNYTLTKTFTISAASASTYSITLPSEVNGNSVTANVNAISSVAENTSVTLTIHTAENYTLANISATGVTLSGSGDTRTFTMPAANVTITATWTVTQTDNSDSNTNETYTVTETGGIEVSTVTTSSDASSITIPAQVGSTNVTSISNNAFSGINNKSNIKSVDLSATAITNVEVNRESGVFNGFPEETMIYMPAGNTEASGQKNVIIGGTCSDFVMTDEKSYNIPTSFTAMSATLSRSFTSDVTCTLCLPYAIPAATIASFGKIYYFSGINGTTIQMTEQTGDLEANTPYIFVPNNAATGITTTGSISVSMSDAETHNNTAKFTFKGVYEHKVFSSTEISSGVYGFAADADHGAASVGQFVKASNGAWTEGMRAYLEYSEGDLTGTASTRGEGLPDVLNVVLIHANGSTTNIGRLELMTAEDGSPVYNLNGQRVDNSYKGLVIKNGKKVVVK